MTYLLAKYTLLFLLTAILGAVLGYWWARRNFVDVSESYNELRKANDRSDKTDWDRLWKRLDAMPLPVATDLSGVHERMDSVAASVAALPKPEPVSFTAIESRLDSLSEVVRKIPVPEKQQAPDFGPLIERLDQIDSDVKAIPLPERPATVDLGPVQNELTSLRKTIRDIPAVETQPPADISPVTDRLEILEQTVSAIPQAKGVDLTPVNRRLDTIDADIRSLGKRMTQPARTERTKQKSSREQPRILKAALYGEKDNLKLISGVGPKLERVLNQNGVYYFWQVAAWERPDITAIDERLDTFKGRITRDGWVNQAKRLSREHGAARSPT